MLQEGEKKHRDEWKVVSRPANGSACGARCNCPRKLRLYRACGRFPGRQRTCPVWALLEMSVIRSAMVKVNGGRKCFLPIGSRNAVLRLGEGEEGNVLNAQHHMARMEVASAVGSCDGEEEGSTSPQFATPARPVVVCRRNQRTGTVGRPARSATRGVSNEGCVARARC